MNYKVYQGSELKQTVTSKIAVMNGLQPNTTYEFSVQPDNAQTVGGKTRYTHVAYANSSDSERNMNNWVLSEPAKKSATITYKNGVNTIDYTGVAYYETFNMPIHAKIGDKVSVTFAYTQPSVVSLNGSSNGAPVSFLDQPSKNSHIGINPMYLGVNAQSSKVYTISTTATSETMYLSFNFGYLTDNINYKFELSAQQDFSQDPGDHEYTGWYSDFTEKDSNDPSQYAWSPIQDGDATRDGTKETISVTTRGIRFNIPKTLAVGSSITLRYEEYPLGIVPIGGEPSGMFGGGNKQNLSAKVISTANGSSVVEVAGNVIDVGGANLIVQSDLKSGYINRDNGGVVVNGSDFYSDNYIYTNGKTTFTLSSPDYVFEGHAHHTLAMYDSDKNYLGYQNITSATQTLSNPNVAYIRLSINFVNEGGTLNNLSDWLNNHRYKFEPGTIATPYAAFVDGDTFTAQQDGTCALFSEYKALYY